MNPPGKRKQGRPKMILRKTFEGDLKKMELTWESTERVKLKIEIHGEKEMAALSLMNSRNKRRRI